MGACLAALSRETTCFFFSLLQLRSEKNNYVEILCFLFIRISSIDILLRDELLGDHVSIIMRVMNNACVDVHHQYLSKFCLTIQSDCCDGFHHRLTYFIMTKLLDEKKSVDGTDENSCE